MSAVENQEVNNTVDVFKDDIDMYIKSEEYISFIIEVNENAKHVGGVNIFGSKFGDYPQDIIMIAYYWFFAYFEDEGITGVKGLEDASKSYAILEKLKEAGFNSDEIEKIEYKNFHRVIKTVIK